jgi:hypothetical protein
MFIAEAQQRVSTNMTLRTEKAFAKALEIKQTVVTINKQHNSRMV